MLPENQVYQTDTVGLLPQTSTATGTLACVANKCALRTTTLVASNALPLELISLPNARNLPSWCEAAPGLSYERLVKSIPAHRRRHEAFPTVSSQHS